MSRINNPSLQCLRPYTVHCMPKMMADNIPFDGHRRFMMPNTRVLNLENIPPAKISTEL